jgi:hypothetical protein
MAPIPFLLHALDSTNEGKEEQPKSLLKKEVIE